MIRQLLAAVVLAALAACGGGGAPAPVIAPVVAPVVAPHGPVLFQADFSGPSIGLGFACNGPGVGIDCSTLPPAMTWGIADWDGWTPCVAPGPNRCYSADGALHFNSADNGGWFGILGRSFPKDAQLYLECTVDATIVTPAGYAGCVIYNGEGNYRALYIDGAGFTIYMTTITVHLGAATPGAHVLGLAYDGAGTWRYFVDGMLRQTEAPGALSPDSTFFANDPRPAFWNGFATGKFIRFILFGGY